MGNILVGTIFIFRVLCCHGNTFFKMHFQFSLICMFSSFLSNRNKLTKLFNAQSDCGDRLYNNFMLKKFSRKNCNAFWVKYEFSNIQYKSYALVKYEKIRILYESQAFLCADSEFSLISFALCSSYGHFRAFLKFFSF